MRVLPTLQKQRHPLASGAAQRRRLAAVPLARSFEAALDGAGLFPLAATGIEVLQINVGRKCNQTCRHCHVDAGPDRTEMMPRDVVEACLRVLDDGGIPDPRHHRRRARAASRASARIVERPRRSGRRVIDRCNLTITRLPELPLDPGVPGRAPGGGHRLAALLTRSRQTDAQRGEGVFEESIAALRELNALGYGRPGSGLVLNLVTNPVGAFLPPDQRAAERDWKRELERRHGIVFDRLFTITNMPISRFLEHLEEKGQTEAYLARLVQGFNPAAAAGVMCRTTLSVAWDGTLYDCDFNQMLDLPLGESLPRAHPRLRSRRGSAGAPSRWARTASAAPRARAQAAAGRSPD